jgi:hypothetical protein
MSEQINIKKVTIENGKEVCNFLFIIMDMLCKSNRRMSIDKNGIDGYGVHSAKTKYAKPTITKIRLSQGT